MQNEVYREADELSLPVTADTKKGSPVKVGSLIGVTATDEGAGGNADGYATVWMHGAYNLPVVAAAAMTVGQAVYFKSDGSLVDASSGNTLFGYALAAVAEAGTVTIPVKLAKV